MDRALACPAPHKKSRHLFCVFVEKFASRAAGGSAQKNGGGHWSARSAQSSPPALASFASAFRSLLQHAHTQGSCLVVASTWEVRC
jgi:hypothetical protein